MATSIASGALKPKVAVTLSASLNLVGAFLSTAVAATIAKGLVDSGLVTLELIFAGLVGGITWNLLTWLLGIPSSSSHALIGGIVGAMIAAVGGHGVIWRGLVSTVMIPAVCAPAIAMLVASVGTWLVYRAVRGVPEARTDRGFRYGQIGSASLVSLARHQRRPEDDGRHLPGPDLGAASKSDAMPPFWVILSCALAIALGTYLGGWRVIRTWARAWSRSSHRRAWPRRNVVGGNHSAVQPLWLLAVHHPRRHHHGHGVGKPGADVRWAWRADGRRLADHAAVRPESSAR